MAVSEASILEFIDYICETLTSGSETTQYYTDFLKQNPDEPWGYNALYRSAKAALELIHFMSDLGSDTDAWSEYRNHLRTVICERWEMYTENSVEYQDAMLAFNNVSYPIHFQGA